MNNILIHGLGQSKNSWGNVLKYLNQNNIEALCPDLFEIMQEDLKDYKMMYNAFANFCHNQKGKVNLCGLSLGGILALDFVKEYPEKVSSLILIGTPYKIPKILFKIQTLIFRIMPKKVFIQIGCSKKEFIALVSSMSNLNIAKNLDKINCRSLIMCGMKDNVNMKSAKLLNKNIENSELKIISNSGHEVNIDNPKELADIICDFWKNNQ